MTDLAPDSAAAISFNRAIAIGAIAFVEQLMRSYAEQHAIFDLFFEFHDTDGKTFVFVGSGWQCLSDDDTPVSVAREELPRTLTFAEIA